MRGIKINWNDIRDEYNRKHGTKYQVEDILIVEHARSGEWSRVAKALGVGFSALRNKKSEFNLSQRGNRIQKELQDALKKTRGQLRVANSEIAILRKMISKGGGPRAKNSQMQADIDNLRKTLEETNRKYLSAQKSIRKLELALIEAQTESKRQTGGVEFVQFDFEGFKAKGGSPCKYCSRQYEADNPVCSNCEVRWASVGDGMSSSEYGYRVYTGKPVVVNEGYV